MSSKATDEVRQVSLQSRAGRWCPQGRRRKEEEEEGEEEEDEEEKDEEEKDEEEKEGLSDKI